MLHYYCYSSQIMADTFCGGFLSDGLLARFSLLVLLVFLGFPSVWLQNLLVSNCSLSYNSGFCLSTIIVSLRSPEGTNIIIHFRICYSYSSVNRSERLVCEKKVVDVVVGNFVPRQQVLQRSGRGVRWTFQSCPALDADRLLNLN